MSKFFYTPTQSEEKINSLKKDIQKFNIDIFFENIKTIPSGHYVTILSQNEEIQKKIYNLIKKNTNLDKLVKINDNTITTQHVTIDFIILNVYNMKGIDGHLIYIIGDNFENQIICKLICECVLPYCIFGQQLLLVES